MRIHRKKTEMSLTIDVVRDGGGGRANDVMYSSSKRQHKDLAKKLEGSLSKFGGDLQVRGLQSLSVNDTCLRR